MSVLSDSGFVQSDGDGEEMPGVSVGSDLEPTDPPEPKNPPAPPDDEKPPLDKKSAKEKGNPDEYFEAVIYEKNCTD